LGAEQTLRTAAMVFAGATGFGSIVAMRDNIPGEPLGLKIPLSVPTGLLVGWGAGVAAPWPMPVTALLVASQANRRDEIVSPGVVCAGIGLGCIFGTLIEPVTRRQRSMPPAVRTAIGFNVGASLFLMAAGLSYRASVLARRSDRSAQTPL
jgi:hypothetical protein